MTMIGFRRLTALIAVGAILVGCVPGSGPVATASTAASPVESAASSATAAGSAVPTLDTSTPVTLAEWDTETSAGPSGEMDALNKAFHDMYPNVTIKRTAKAFDDYVATIKLAASAPDAPDILQGNEGYSVDAALVKAGLILPLDDDSKAYGWDTRFGSPATLDVLRWSTDGTKWTQGPLWGIAQKAEVLGVFYNKKTMQALGLSVPTTFDEFQQTLATAKAGNVSPIVVGGLDGWPLGHIFMMLQALYEPPQNITNWTFAVPGSTFAPLASNVGWFALPGLTAGAPSPTTGSLSIPYHISKASKTPDIDAAYIDFITSSQAADVVAGKGDLPAAPLATASVVDPQSSLGEIIAGFNDKSKGGLLTPYLDWASSTMGDTLFGGLQKLTASKLTPAEFTAEVQKDWSKAHPG